MVFFICSPDPRLIFVNVALMYSYSLSGIFLENGLKYFLHLKLSIDDWGEVTKLVEKNLVHSIIAGHVKT